MTLRTEETIHSGETTSVDPMDFEEGTGGPSALTFAANAGDEIIFQFLDYEFIALHVTVYEEESPPLFSSPWDLADDWSDTDNPSLNNGGVWSYRVDGTLIAAHVDAVWAPDTPYARELIGPNVGQFSLKGKGRVRFFRHGTYWSSRRTGVVTVETAGSHPGL